MLKLNASNNLSLHHISLSKVAVWANAQLIPAARSHRRVACCSLEKRFQESYTMSQGNVFCLLPARSFFALVHSLARTRAHAQVQVRVHKITHILTYLHTSTHTNTHQNEFASVSPTSIDYPAHAYRKSSTVSMCLLSLS